MGSGKGKARRAQSKIRTPRIVANVKERVSRFIYDRENSPPLLGGEKVRMRNGKLHCYYGPAVISKNGTKEWWEHDERHREGGPAIEYADGGKEWYLNDRRHRVGGPAVEKGDGTREWYENRSEECRV